MSNSKQTKKQTKKQDPIARSRTYIFGVNQKTDAFVLAKKDRPKNARKIVKLKLESSAPSPSTARTPVI